MMFDASMVDLLALKEVETDGHLPFLSCFHSWKDKHDSLTDRLVDIWIPRAAEKFVNKW